MKKFSNITGQKISSEPKIEKKTSDKDSLKSQISNLIEQFLVIRTYGPVDRYQRAGNIKISGQEVFIEALLNLINDKNLKEQTKLLESLKLEISDWKLIDEKLNEMSSKISQLETNNQLLSQKENILKLVNKYNQDEDFLLKFVDESCKKITSKKILQNKSLSCEILFNETNKLIFDKINEKYKQRINQLTS